MPEPAAIPWTAALRDAPLEDVLAAIYRREINLTLTWLWDSGVEVRLGDEMKGDQAERNFRPEEIPHIGRWLFDQVDRLHPDLAGRGAG